MKVNLSVVNRLSFLGLLPGEGDLTTIKIIRELREELSLTEAEHSVLHIQQLGEGRIRFDENVVPLIEFEFEGVRELLLNGVKTQLRTMESDGQLKLEFLPLYEVLIEGQAQEE